MRKILVAIAVVGSLLGLAGCKKKGDGGGAADMTAKMTEFKDAMCKCKPGDADCANKVVEEQKKWTEEWAKTAAKAAPADPAAAAEAAKKMEPITTEYGKCMTAAMTPAAGDAPKDPGGAPAAAGKSCEELGGTADGANCNFKATVPQPFEAVYTGKFEGTTMRPEPGAVFKVTSKFDRPVAISSAQAYVYDKAGKQLEFVLGDQKLKYAQDSKSGLLELNPGETKDFVHSIGKENLPPEADTVQVEFLAWTADGKEFSRNLETGQDEVRPKDGWK